MEAPQLIRGSSCGVTLLGDAHRPCGVTLAFTERTGGVSTGAYESLNLGDGCGDDGELVTRNRLRALKALGCDHLEGRLINPVQVHGTAIVTVADDTPESISRAQKEARAGADAVVCTAKDVPVLLCYADCVPIILVAPRGFAVVHSGWKGTLARIPAKATEALLAAADCRADEVLAYVGPHIGGEDYTVSEELLRRFVAAFGEGVRVGERNLSLGVAVRSTLQDAGIAAEGIACAHVSTMSAMERFFSYRGSGGVCGRHGALAWMGG